MTHYIALIQDDGAGDANEIHQRIEGSVDILDVWSIGLDDLEKQYEVVQRFADHGKLSTEAKSQLSGLLKFIRALLSPKV